MIYPACRCCCLHQILVLNNFAKFWFQEKFACVLPQNSYHSKVKQIETEELVLQPIHNTIHIIEAKCYSLPHGFKGSGFYF